MMKKIKRKSIVRMSLCALTAICLVGICCGTQAEAKSKIRLSSTQKMLTEGQTFTLSLKGVSAKVKTKNLKWRVSDTDVAGIKKKSHNKATIKIWEDGETTVSVTYKGKKYRCRIKAVSRDYYFGEETDDSDVTNESDGEGCLKDKPSLNSEYVELHYIEEYAIPYIGKDSGYNYSFQFRVKNADTSSVKWSIEGDKTARIRYRINDNGVIYMFMGNDLSEDYTECTVAAMLPDGEKLTAKVRGYDDEGTFIRKKIEDFKSRYITPNMSEYDKMDSVAQYVSHEYDYELYQPSWSRYMITGSGDCMASRLVVEYLCRDLGLNAAACRSIDSHGQTIVKADGGVYLVTTGFTGKKPRYYEVRQIDRETFDKINEDNNINPAMFWD